MTMFLALEVLAIAAFARSGLQKNGLLLVAIPAVLVLAR